MTGSGSADPKTSAGDEEGSRDTVPPPTTYSDVRALSRRPPAGGHEDPRLDSSALTLPTAYAIPVLLGEAAALASLSCDDPMRDILTLVDGTRTIADIAACRHVPSGEMQLHIADLRDRGVVRLK
jgi:hypothetical protein